MVRVKQVLVGSQLSPDVRVTVRFSSQRKQRGPHVPPPLKISLLSSLWLYSLSEVTVSSLLNRSHEVD